MTENKKTSQVEVLTEVLGITRDQLSRSLNLTAELEALLNIERRRNSELSAELEEAKNSKGEKSEDVGS